jgi:hypothetical protein
MDRCSEAAPSFTHSNPDGERMDRTLRDDAKCPVLSVISAWAVLPWVSTNESIVAAQVLG